jgi:hypothetical protein
MTVKFVWGHEDCGDKQPKALKLGRFHVPNDDVARPHREQPGTASRDRWGRSSVLLGKGLTVNVPAVPSSPRLDSEAKVLPCLFGFRSEQSKAA